MNIFDILLQADLNHATSIAVVDGAERITYRRMWRRVQSLASFLRRMGVHKSDRIAIFDVNSHYFFEAYFAAAGLGAILVPINIRLGQLELDYIINDAQPRWLLAHPDFCHQIEGIIRKKDTPLEGLLWMGEIPPQDCDIPFYSFDDIRKVKSSFEPETIEPDDPAQIYYTSGTTGQPKGVVLTHRNVCAHAAGAIEELGLTHTDVWGHIAPMFHLADAWATFAITRVGGRHVMLPVFEVRAALQLIAEERITISNLIPTMLNLMVKYPRLRDYDLSSLRVMLSGGAPIAPDVVRKIMERFGCDYVQTYGMTETSPYLTLSLLHEHLKGLPVDEQFRYKAKTGRKFITVDLKVLRKDGKTQVDADGQEVGEIWVKGETVTPGYWNRPDETRAAFREGWLMTGDLATLDREGYVNIVDRKKDMILSGGENIYSVEVESVLYDNRKILEAAVFGTPDEIWGELVTAAVVLKPGKTVTEEELMDFCRERLTAFKVPRRIIELAELPKNGTGKIFKKELKERYSKA